MVWRDGHGRWMRARQLACVGFGLIHACARAGFWLTGNARLALVGWRGPEHYSQCPRKQDSCLPRSCECGAADANKESRERSTGRTAPPTHPTPGEWRPCR
ncbi:unnamed protein product, partial [Ectocarpus sp. 12 AP-2014]